MQVDCRTGDELAGKPLGVRTFCVGDIVEFTNQLGKIISIKYVQQRWSGGWDAGYECPRAEILLHKVVDHRELLDVPTTDAELDLDEGNAILSIAWQAGELVETSIERYALSRSR